MWSLSGVRIKQDITVPGQTSLGHKERPGGKGAAKELLGEKTVRLTTALFVSSLVIPSLAVGLAPRASRQAGSLGVPRDVILRDALLTASLGGASFPQGPLGEQCLGR